MKQTNPKSAANKTRYYRSVDALLQIYFTMIGVFVRVTCHYIHQSYVRLHNNTHLAREVHIYIYVCTYCFTDLHILHGEISRM